MQVHAQLRENFGRLKTKSLRGESLIPATIYTLASGVLHISLPEKEMDKLISDYRFLNTKLIVALSGKEYSILPKTVDFHPVTERVLHVEFKEIPSKGLVDVLVPVRILNANKSLGIKAGGKLNMPSHNILVRTESNNIPEEIAVDIEKFGIGRTLFAKALPPSESYSFPKNVLVLSILGRGRKDKNEEATTSDSK